MINGILLIYHNYSYYSFYCTGPLLLDNDFWLSTLIALSMLITPLYVTTNSWNSEPQNIEYRTAERRRIESLRSVFFKIDRSTQKLTTGRIPYFDIRHSLFDILFFWTFEPRTYNLFKYGYHFPDNGCG